MITAASLHSPPSGLLASTSDLSIISVALTLLVAFIAYRYVVRPYSNKLRPTYSIHPLLPGFVSGAYAAYQLGVNETDFLQQLYKDYGPVVYVPAPLAQYLVLSDRHIRQVYNGRYNKELSFIPIRKALSGVIFGTSAAALALPEMEQHIFPIHAKALSKGNLKDPVARFQKAIEEGVAAQTPQDSTDLVHWTYDLMFKASMAALFGEDLDLSMQTFQEKFRAFDDAFPLLASGMFPRFVQDYLPSLTPSTVRDGIYARNYLNAKFGEWAVKTGCAPLDEKDVVKAMSDVIQDLEWSTIDLGSCMLGDFWALLANNPYAISWIMIYLTQIDKSLFSEVLAEVDGIDITQDPPADAHLPLLTSIIYETLRLHSSNMSMRQATSKTDPFVFEEIAEVRPGELLMCVPRVGHLDAEVWGENAEIWDGKRFFDGDGTGTGNAKSKRIFDVRAFGGGVSICEGRSLALAELKSMLVIILQNLSFEALPPPPAQPMDVGRCIDGSQVALPKPKPGRRRRGDACPDTAQIARMMPRVSRDLSLIHMCTGAMYFVCTRRVPASMTESSETTFVPTRVSRQAVHSDPSVS